MLSVLVAGWLMARQETIAASMLGGGDEGDPMFLRMKAAAAAYFRTAIVPEATGPQVSRHVRGRKPALRSAGRGLRGLKVVLILGGRRQSRVPVKPPEQEEEDGKDAVEEQIVAVERRQSEQIVGAGNRAEHQQQQEDQPGQAREANRVNKPPARPEPPGARARRRARSTPRWWGTARAIAARPRRRRCAADRPPAAPAEV
jgi:hypothetical protein